MTYNIQTTELFKQHRLVYEINENVVTVVLLSAFGHYDDK